MNAMKFYSDSPHYCRKPHQADKGAIWYCNSCDTYWQAYSVEMDGPYSTGRYLQWRKVQDSLGTPFPPTKEEHREYLVWAVIAVALVLVIIIFGYII